MSLRNTVIFRIQNPEAATKGVRCKKVVLGVSQNSQENTFTRVSFLIKLQVSGLELYLIRDSGTGVFL